MTTQGARSSPAYAEQIRGLDRELRARRGRGPQVAAALLLLGGIALLSLMGKCAHVPGGRARAGLGVLLAVSFALWEMAGYVRGRRFAAGFYGEMLPAALGEAYAAYAPRPGAPDPSFFDPAEGWRLPTTVTSLVLSMGGPSFRAQGVYRIRREYLRAGNALGSEGDGESGHYRISQDLIWRVRTRGHVPFRLSLRTSSGTVGETVSGMFGKACDRMLRSGMRDVRTGDDAFDRGFRVRADDVERAGPLLRAYGRRLAELRDNMGRFSMEYAGDTLSLSFSDFAPIDTADSNGVRRTGLPNGLSAERVEQSARELDFLAGWLRSFVTMDTG